MATTTKTTVHRKRKPTEVRLLNPPKVSINACTFNNGGRLDGDTKEVLLEMNQTMRIIADAQYQLIEAVLKGVKPSDGPMLKL